MEILGREASVGAVARVGRVQGPVPARTRQATVHKAPRDLPATFNRLLRFLAPPARLWN